MKVDIYKKKVKTTHHDLLPHLRIIYPRFSRTEKMLFPGKIFRLDVLA